MINQMRVDGRSPLRLIGSAIFRDGGNIADKISVADPDNEEAVGGIGRRGETVDIVSQESHGFDG